MRRTNSIARSVAAAWASSTARRIAGSSARSRSSCCRPELAFRSEIRSRFLREAETAAQLSHPCIVPIYSVDEKDGLVYFVMAFVDGDTLAKRIHDRGALDPAEVRRILREVGDALAYAHAHGVVHRDIKPDNILLDAASNRPMVTDFGIARAISDGSARLTATGIAIGTPAFMSPEQSAGDRDVDGRSDLYSLGVVAYQMLCGELPFNATNTPALLVKHLSERPVPVDQRASNIPPDLARAVMLCLEKNPDDRFPSAQEFVTALDSGQRSESSAAARDAGTGAVVAQHRQSGYLAVLAPIPRSDRIVRRRRTKIARAGKQVDVVKFRKKLGPFMFVGAALVVLAPFNVGARLLRHLGLVRGVSRVPIRAALERGLRLARCVPAAAAPPVHGSRQRIRRRGAGVLESKETRRSARASRRAALVAGDVQPGAEHVRSPAAGTAAAHTPRASASFANGPHAAVTRRAIERLQRDRAHRRDRSRKPIARAFRR